MSKFTPDCPTRSIENERMKRNGVVMGTVLVSLCTDKWIGIIFCSYEPKLEILYFLVIESLWPRRNLEWKMKDTDVVIHLESNIVN